MPDAWLRGARLWPLRPLMAGMQGFTARTHEGRRLALGPFLISSRANRPVPLPVALQTGTPARLEGEFIWAGAIYTVFGHLLTETVPQLAVLRPLLDAHPRARLLGFAAPIAPDLGAPAYRHFLNRLSIAADRVVVVPGPCVIDRLLVPPSAFAGKYRYRPQVAAALDAIFAAPRPAATERVFFTRRFLPKASRVPEIEGIEQRFQAAGYDLVAPERLSLDDQIDLAQRAWAIAGENGSAVHWSLFGPRCRHVASLGWRLKLQEGICALRGQNLATLADPLARLVGGRHQSVPLAAIDRYLRKLD